MDDEETAAVSDVPRRWEAARLSCIGGNLVAAGAAARGRVTSKKTAQPEVGARSGRRRLPQVGRELSAGDRTRFPLESITRLSFRSLESVFGGRSEPRSRLIVHAKAAQIPRLV